MTPSLVSTAWLAENISDPNIRVVEIDRDDLDAYQAGHIPGAIGWHWKSMLWDAQQRQFPSPQVFAQRLSNVGVSNETTVVLCGDPVQFGTYAWWVFKYLGHKDVRLLDGGMTGWRREGRPLSQSVADVPATDYQPNTLCEPMRAGRNDVRSALVTTDVAIIDHRSMEEFSGLRVSPPGMADVGAERYGRIPGAVHLPYTSMLNPNDSFKTPEELQALVSPILRDKDAPAILYCRLSHRATLAYFAMTEILGYRNLSVYDGSWTEWGSMVGTPIEF